MSATNLQPPLFHHTRQSLRPGEVALALGVTVQHVYGLCESGEIKYVHISPESSARTQHKRIQRASVEAWYLEKYLAANGEEFPWANPELVTFYRNLLRGVRANCRNS